MGSVLQHWKLKTTVKQAYFGHTSDNYINLSARLNWNKVYDNLWNSSDAKTL